MKLVLAIVSSDDSHEVVKNLNSKNFQVTKLSSTGGFLRKGNTTLLVGCKEEEVEQVIALIKDQSQSRTEVITTATSYDMAHVLSVPIEVKVGGATVFVIDIEQFHKL